MLSLEMKDPVPVSGTYTTSGLAITTRDCGTAKTLVFTEVALGAKVEVQAKCQFIDVGWNFSTQLFPGTYRVEVGGQPVFGDPIEVKDEPLSGLSLENPWITVTGAILRNHAPITKAVCTDLSNNGTLVKWTEIKRNQAFQVRAQCNATGWSYSIPLPPGTYRAEVDPPSDVALPDFAARVIDEVVIDGAPLQRALDLDVIVGSASGIYLRNGQPTPCNTRSSLMFYERSKNQRFSALDTCTGTAGEPWTFTARELLAGNYEIHAGAAGAVPLGLLWKSDVRIADDVPINVVIDDQPLAGKVTYKGAPLPAGTTPTPSLIFTQVNGGASRTATFTCSADGCPFEGYLPVGKYRVELTDRSLPGRVALASALSVAGPVSDATLTFDTVSVSGSITRDHAPVVSTGCAKATPLDTLTLTSDAGSFEVTLPITCDTSKGWTVSGLVPPGTYRGKVNANHAGSPFENTPGALSGEVTIRADQTSYEFDAPGLVRVAGDLIVNGQTHTPSTCTSVAFHFKHLAEGTILKVPAVCKGKLGIDAQIVRGTYQVTLEPGFFPGAQSSIGFVPGAQIVVAPELELSSDRDDVTFEVQTRQILVQLTRDGMPLMDKTCGKDDFNTSSAYIAPVNGGEGESRRIICPDGDWRFGAWLYPGVYRISVSVYRDSSQPVGIFTVLPELRVE
jgi:hypothetical protein